MRSRLPARPSNLGPFATLLATLVVSIFVAPFFEGDIPGYSRLRLVTIAVLLSGVYGVSRRRGVFWVGALLAVTTLGTEGGIYGRPTPALAVANFALTIAFLAFLGSVILHAILTQERVTPDTILGGISIYLILGLTWSVAYSLLEYARPGSFSLAGEPLSTVLHEAELFREELHYFSFVTLTTLGYGEILPETRAAQALATAEAATGVLYVAIFIARLVGLHMVHESRKLDR